MPQWHHIKGTVERDLTQLFFLIKQLRPSRSESPINNFDLFQQIWQGTVCTVPYRLALGDSPVPKHL